MVNYMSRNEDSNSKMEEGSSLVGGALNMLSQYEANLDGDEYSKENPSQKFDSALQMNDNDKKSLKDLGSSLVGGSRVGGSQVGGSQVGGSQVGGSQVGGSLLASHLARKMVLHLTPIAFHHLTEVARHIHRKRKGGSLDEAGVIGGEGGVYHGGALKDISMAKSQHHLACMLARDHEIEGRAGGNFWDTLGSVVKTVGPLGALML